MIPDYQTLMLPVLRAAVDEPLQSKLLIEKLRDEFKLSREEREHLLPSGKQKTFDNRVHWAKTYLKQAGLVRYPKRGFHIATDLGKKVLSAPPPKIDNKFLKNFQSFQDFQNRKSDKEDVENQKAVFENDDSTPDEIMREAYAQINKSLAADLISRIRESSPQFFEQLIVDLLLAMGYGGTSEDAARALGQSGDNGIDGVVDQDPLGVDQVYVQAKRYSEGNNVGSGDIRDFFGALSLKKAQKGIFFTTSRFSPSAKQTAKDLGMRIVLIDGAQLTTLMIRYNVGCRDEELLYLKKIDDDFFDQE